MDDSVDLPNWAIYSIAVGLLLFSGLFSGLTLGLLSLDNTGLLIVAEAGSANDKEYASKFKYMLFNL